MAVLLLAEELLYGVGHLFRAAERPGSVTPQQPPEPWKGANAGFDREKSVSTALFYAGRRAGVAGAVPTVSFELYPPRNPSRLSAVWAGVTKLISAAPNYVSVTYGAAGASADTRDRSVQVLMKVLDSHPGLPAVAHLTCLGSTRNEMALIIRLLLRAGIRDFLALRGDPPAAESDVQLPRTDLHRAVDLVRLIREIAAEELPRGVGSRHYGSGIDTAEDPNDYVSIAVAAYPATSGQARANDIAALIEKEESGADYAITQVFYEVADYASLVRELTMAGGKLPIVPGILPLHDLRRLRAMERIAGIPIPPHIEQLFDETSAPSDPSRCVAQRLRATVDLIADVLDAGAPGVHLYTFNRPRPTLDILEYLRGCGYLTAHAPGTPRDFPQLSHGDVDTELVQLALRRLSPSS